VTCFDVYISFHTPIGLKHIYNPNLSVCEIIQRISDFFLKLITSTHFQFDTNGSSVKKKTGLTNHDEKTFMSINTNGSEKRT
jgi:hypothetical protein